MSQHRGTKPVYYFHLGGVEIPSASPYHAEKDARDPNISLDDLLILVTMFPAAVLENPARPLWSLEDPLKGVELENRARAVLAQRAVDTLQAEDTSRRTEYAGLLAAERFLARTPLEEGHLCPDRAGWFERIKRYKFAIQTSTPVVKTWGRATCLKEDDVHNVPYLLTEQGLSQLWPTVREIEGRLTGYFPAHSYRAECWEAWLLLWQQAAEELAHPPWHEPGAPKDPWIAR